MSLPVPPNIVIARAAACGVRIDVAGAARSETPVAAALDESGESLPVPPTSVTLVPPVEERESLPVPPNMVIAVPAVWVIVELPLPPSKNSPLVP